MDFKEALDYAQKLESYMSPGERVFSLLHVDGRKRVNEALSDLSSAFLDRGAAKWAPQFRDKVGVSVLKLLFTFSLVFTLLFISFLSDFFQLLCPLSLIILIF
jgi:hypothetical protein